MQISRYFKHRDTRLSGNLADDDCEAFKDEQRVTVRLDTADDLIALLGKENL
ncbi:hypothetical protein [Zoogloea sp.]|uniref:hypothetical protein n=1 Tax=Zoogloea sp. TaxID=49181 RepID=UPI002613AECA|nr:hypothetical protein [Zoogloea sp.]MDD3353881.1 hypothetical protein [Zoogloea sp.]